MNGFLCEPIHPLVFFHSFLIRVVVYFLHWFGSWSLVIYFGSWCLFCNVTYEQCERARERGARGKEAGERVVVQSSG